MLISVCQTLMKWQKCPYKRQKDSAHHQPPHSKNWGISLTLETTPRNKRASPTIVTERQRQELQLRCISLMAKGLSIAEISEVEGMTIWHTRQLLDRINREARDGILSSMISDRVPLAVEVSLETNRILIKKCMHIMYSSKDERVQLQAAAQISSLNEKNNDILSQSGMIANAIKRVLVVHPSTPSLIEEQEDEPVETNTNHVIEDKELTSLSTNNDNRKDNATTTTLPPTSFSNLSISMDTTAGAEPIAQRLEPTPAAEQSLEPTAIQPQPTTTEPAEPAPVQQQEEQQQEQQQQEESHRDG